MGEAQTVHFYDFGTFERVPKPQNQLFSFLETPTKISFINLKILELHNCVDFGKDGHQQMMNIRIIKSRKMDIGPISPRKHGMDIW